ncbi:putative basic proline-rich protein-like [Iris pallida]|uniref:Basic proline-rich protein-like n=1 Tax=Iris pallida TaxID=29817 RepID=A0AAX6IM02_IRIPA|nr:putative basic proline-rich protein-like [Iris pallida]KAJ6809779.1 putative basic proline-rich protein-like [Iris pallida]KAJ6846421.1 putative basic proline-rich protein-like [Iris pallida]KAJ6846422.1 putative basic proline-rich protein-like [Iris pallida]KAJ6853777.1 putative basic proline-rich protein-like [Iris pallida]
MSGGCVVWGGTLRRRERSAEATRRCPPVGEAVMLGHSHQQGEERWSWGLERRLNAGGHVGRSPRNSGTAGVQIRRTRRMKLGGAGPLGNAKVRASLPLLSILKFGGLMVVVATTETGHR